MADGAGVAALTLAALVLGLRGVHVTPKLVVLVGVATALGTALACRRPAAGARLERGLRRAAFSALVATVLLAVLALATS